MSVSRGAYRDHRFQKLFYLHDAFGLDTAAMVEQLEEHIETRRLLDQRFVS